MYLVTLADRLLTAHVRRDNFIIVGIFLYIHSSPQPEDLTHLFSTFLDPESLHLSLSLSLYIYIYICVCVCVCVSPVAQSVQCLTTDRTAGVRSPTEPEDFSSSLCVQTGSGAHPGSCTVGTGGSLSGGKAGPGRDADHTPPSRAEVKKE
jgi:hypothetical protein